MRTAWMVAVAALALPQLAMAEQWRTVHYAGSAPNRSAQFLDLNSVRRTGQLVRVSTRSLHETETEGGVTASAADIEIDCEDYGYRVVEEVVFLRDGTSSRRPTSDIQRYPPFPSFERSLAMVVCGAPPGPSSPDVFAMEGAMRRVWSMNP